MPIDKTFRETWKKSGQHKGHSVWEIDDSIIHGDVAGVDFSLCYGCGKCISACPTNVFELHTDENDRLVVDPINDADCILCLVCELVCPVDAISVRREGGSDETLKSLLRGSD